MIFPAINNPVVSNTATLETPPTLTVILPPELTTVTLDDPLLILATEVITPLRHAPLPKKYSPVILPVADTIPDARKLLALIFPVTLILGIFNPPDPI
jgi:hypothetical protein